MYSYMFMSICCFYLPIESSIYMVMDCAELKKRKRERSYESSQEW